MNLFQKGICYFLLHKNGKRCCMWSWSFLGPARCSVLVWPHKLYSAGPDTDRYIHRTTCASSHIMLRILSSGQAIGALKCLTLPLHISSNFNIHFNLVKYCLYLHQECLVTASLDGLFEVTGAKISHNKLLKANNTRKNPRFSLKLD